MFGGRCMGKFVISRGLAVACVCLLGVGVNV